MIDFKIKGMGRQSIKDRMAFVQELHFPEYILSTYCTYYI